MTVTTEHREPTLPEFLKALKTIKEEGPRNEWYGICDNIGAVLRQSNLDYANDGEIAAYMYCCFEQWPKFSGNGHYPVPHPEYIGDLERASLHYETYYDAELSMWRDDDPYDQLRWELLDFMIEWFNNLIAEKDNE